MSELQITNLILLGQAQDRLNNRINQIHESKQQMVEDSSQFFRPLTTQSEQSAQEVMKAVETMGKTVAAPEEAIVQNALERGNDPVFGIVKHGDNYAFGLVLLVEQFDPQLKPDYDALSVSSDGVGVVGSTTFHEISKPLMHVLTRNARPLNAKVKKIFLDLVVLSIGPLLVTLSDSKISPALERFLQNSVKFETIIRKKFGFDFEEDGFATPPTDDTPATEGAAGDDIDSTEPSGAGYDVRRMAVLMGAAEAGNMKSGLREFTSILDRFWRKGQLTKKQYHMMLRRYMK